MYGKKDRMAAHRAAKGLVHLFAPSLGQNQIIGIKAERGSDQGRGIAVFALWLDYPGRKINRSESANQLPLPVSPPITMLSCFSKASSRIALQRFGKKEESSFTAVPILSFRSEQE